jgi:hypothetical protein
MGAFSMPRNNAGDDGSLIDPQGRVHHHMNYTAPQAASGNVVTF